MSFYEQVKSPIDDEEFLKSLILLYAEQDIDARKSEDYVYDAFITHSEAEANEDKDAYMKKFKKYVEKDMVCKLLRDVLKYSEEEAEQIYAENFPETEASTKESSKPAIEIDKEDFIEQLRDAGCIGEVYGIQYYQMSIREIIEDVFDGHGSMGYHIYESKFGNIWARGGDLVKLYINVGEDTYEFSKLFREKCEDQRLSYMYKVVNPKKGEEVRADKMCVYSGLKDIEKFIDVIKSIKEEHPEFDFRQASPIMGNIDGWIGVGSDPINFQFASSYSESRALLFENALRKVFGNKSKEKIEKMLSRNPNIIEKVKTAIKKEAAKYVITQHLVFDDVIIEAFNSPDPGKRDSIYDEHRNELYTRLKSGELPKQSIWQKLKSYMLSERKIKSGSKQKLNSGMQLPSYQLEIPTYQTAYGEEEHYEDIPTQQQSMSAEEQYRQSLKIDNSVSENNNGVPIQQTAKHRENNGMSENDKDVDDDSSDVWI